MTISITTPTASRPSPGLLCVVVHDRHLPLEEHLSLDNERVVQEDHVVLRDGEVVHQGRPTKLDRKLPRGVEREQRAGNVTRWKVIVKKSWRHRMLTSRKARRVWKLFSKIRTFADLRIHTSCSSRSVAAMISLVLCQQNISTLRYDIYC